MVVHAGRQSNGIGGRQNHAEGVGTTQSKVGLHTAGFPGPWGAAGCGQSLVAAGPVRTTASGGARLLRQAGMQRIAGRAGTDESGSCHGCTGQEGRDQDHAERLGCRKRIGSNERGARGCQLLNGRLLEDTEVWQAHGSFPTRIAKDHVMGWKTRAVGGFGPAVAGSARVQGPQGVFNIDSSPASGSETGPDGKSPSSTWLDTLARPTDRVRFGATGMNRVWTASSCCRSGNGRLRLRKPRTGLTHFQATLRRTVGSAWFWTSSSIGCPKAIRGCGHRRLKGGIRLCRRERPNRTGTPVQSVAESLVQCIEMRV